MSGYRLIALFDALLGRLAPRGDSLMTRFQVSAFLSVLLLMSLTTAAAAGPTCRKERPAYVAPRRRQGAGVAALVERGGDAKAQFELGKIYIYEGHKGVTDNDAEGVNLLCKAALQNFAPAGRVACGGPQTRARRGLSEMVSQSS